jgi:twinkle protein
MNSNQITAGEISVLLANKAEEVCKLLLPGGKAVKGEWLAGDIGGEKGITLKVQLEGTYKGTWKDWANDQDKGDLIDLWRLSKGLSHGDAFKQVKDFLGIKDVVTPPGERKYKKPPDKLTPAPRPDGMAYKFLTGTRKLTAETITAFQVGTDQRAIVFPCFGPDGNLINRSYRTIPKDGEKKEVWQDKDCAPCLFGWQALAESAYQSRTVLLAEGQIDAMTWHQWGIPALSIPAGSGQTWISAEWDNLAMFDKILIAFDSDMAGQKNADSVSKRLGPHRCFRVSIPHKDANEALQAGKTALDARKWASEAKPPSLEGIVTANDLERRLLIECEVKPMPLCLPFFKIDWETEKGFYFRPGEITLWTGATGNGKSTFLNFLQMNLSCNEKQVFVASMEVKAETTLRRTIEAYWGAGGIIKDRQEQTHVIKWLDDFGQQIVFADKVGYMEAEELFEMMEFSFRRHGCSHFIIDSLMRIAGLEEDAKATGDFMNRLANFAKNTGVHVHLVAHPRKMQSGQRAGTMDIKGSSLIANNADNIVGVARNQEKWDLQKEGLTDPDDLNKMHDTEITVEKQRESGWTGTFYLDFDPRRLTYKESKSRTQARPKPEPKKSWATKKDW